MAENGKKYGDSLVLRMT